MTGTAGHPQPPDSALPATGHHTDLNELRASLDAATVMMQAGITTTAARLMRLHLRHIDPGRASVLDVLIDAADIYTGTWPDPAWLTYLTRARISRSGTPQAPAIACDVRVVGDWPWELAVASPPSPGRFSPARAGCVQGAEVGPRRWRG